MISVENLSLQFNGVFLLKNITFLINKKDRIGLVGKNGAGKSTLLKILIGEINPESGNVVVPSNASLGYLPQQMKIKDSLTVIDECKKAFAEINKLKSDIEKINHELAERTDYESDEYLNLINKLTEKTERLHLLGEGNMDEQLENCLTGLGFERSDFNRLTSEFSGGWRMRIELVKILLIKPDVLLLDEPTNHLDIESIQWLENFLKDYPGAVVLISHDRAFLNNITNRTIEISLGEIYDFNLPYTKFTERREEMREQQLSAYKNQQKMIEETEEFIERFRYKATKAVQVQSRIKQLEKIERIEIDEFDNSSMNIKFPPAPRSGKVVVEIKNLTKKYDDFLVLKDLDLLVERGEKIAFVGKNGEGKTTLSKIIMNELDYSGELNFGGNVKIGYFAQNQDEIMNETKTVFDTIDAVAVGDIRTKIRDILGAFLFSGEDIDKKVKVLSGGERSRLALAKLLLEPYNLLVLDEPTNHLDMRSKDILKQALIKYDGTLVIVSHDREFLDGLVTKVYEFKNKGIKEYIGGIYDFLYRRNIENLKELERKEKTNNENNKKKEITDNKLSFLEKKEFEKKVRKVNNQISVSEKKIEELEVEMEEIQKKMETGENISFEPTNEIFVNYENIKKQLDEEIKNWEVLNIELEELKTEGK